MQRRLNVIVNRNYTPKTCKITSRNSEALFSVVATLLVCHKRFCREKLAVARHRGAQGWRLPHHSSRKMMGSKCCLHCGHGCFVHTWNNAATSITAPFRPGVDPHLHLILASWSVASGLSTCTYVPLVPDAKIVEFIVTWYS